MKKYLGSYMQLYAGIVLIFAFLFPIGFCVYQLFFGEKDSDTYILIGLLMAFPILSGFTIIKCAHQLFSIGIFESDKVTVKCPLRKSYSLKYKDMKDAGVGYYFHGGYGTALGSRVNYMYLAGRKLTDEQKKLLNLLQISRSFIKFGVDKELYEYLIKTLPPDLSDTLKKSYEEYFDDYYKNGKSKFFKK